MDIHCIFCIIIENYLYFIFCSPFFRLWLLGVSWVSACVHLTLQGFLSISLLFNTARCSKLILGFPAPVLQSASSPRSPGYFYWEIILENIFFVLGVPVITGVSFLLGPLSWENKKMYLCILSCEYPYIYKYFHI